MFAPNLRDSKNDMKRNKQKLAKVKLIPPTEEAARDEGPRLVPLDERLGHKAEIMDYYVKLADLALTKKQGR